MHMNRNRLDKRETGLAYIMALLLLTVFVLLTWQDIVRYLDTLW